MRMRLHLPRRRIEPGAAAAKYAIGPGGGGSATQWLKKTCPDAELDSRAPSGTSAIGLRPVASITATEALQPWLNPPAVATGPTAMPAWIPLASSQPNVCVVGSGHDSNNDTVNWLDKGSPTGVASSSLLNSAPSGSRSNRTTQRRTAPAS